MDMYIQSLHRTPLGPRRATPGNAAPKTECFCGLFSDPAWIQLVLGAAAWTLLK